jgi:predicted exporter
MPLLIRVSGYSNVQPAVSDETASAAATNFPATVQSHLAWLSVLVAAIVLLGITRPALWESDLAALVPVAKERLQRDRELRAALGAPEIGYLLAVSGDSYEAVLERTEQLEPLVERAREAGFLAGATLATTLLPSERTQRQRLEYIRGITDLSQRLETAAVNMPYNATAFDPFVAAVAGTVTRDTLVNQATWQGTRFAQLASFSVYEADEQWVSQSLLYGLTDPQRMQELLTALPGSSLIDLRSASLTLVDAYRQRILSMLAMTAFLALLLLWWRIGLGRRMLWVTGSIVAALSLTVVLEAWLFGGLSLFALMACVLVAGLGLDYGLFCSRASEAQASAAATAHAVRACALSTFAAFAVLAFSPIPVLQDIGFTVATGVALTYLLMLAGRGRPAASSG